MSKTYKFHKSYTAGLILLTLVVAFLCQVSVASAQDLKQINIAYQQGLIYAPAIMTQQSNCLEKKYPNTQISWNQLNSGSAIRGAMLAGNIDIGVMSGGAFSVGWAAGIDWKYLMNYDNIPMEVMVTEDEYQSLEDFKSQGGKINVVAPDTPEATMVRLAAKRKFGDSTALNGQFVSLGHATGVQALITGQIAADVTTPPFIMIEEGKGARSVLSVSDVFEGGLTGSGPVAFEAFVNKHREFVKAFMKCSAEAVHELDNNSENAAAILSKFFKLQVSQEQLVGIINRMKWTTHLLNLVPFMKTNKKLGLIKKAPDGVEDVLYLDLYEEVFGSYPGS